MDKMINGIILKVSYSETAPKPDVEILGKSMLDWVSLSFGDNHITTISYSENGAITELIRPYLNPEIPYTVVLYSDTPLITKQTVFDAVSELIRSGKNVLKLTRGYVFRTEFILSAGKIYTEQTHYFEVDDFLTACSFKQVALISDILKNRILDFHMEHGVQFEDMASTYIGCDVVIGKGVVIAPNNIIRGKTYIKDNVRLESGNSIDTCIIDEGAKITSSNLSHSFVGKDTTVGPYAYIRPESIIGANCRIGDFVEIKKSIIGDKCKISHLSYVGDCEMGKGCNVGCGVVFVNYDGKNKFETLVGDNVFIGSNSNLIAPLVIKSGSFIAAGSTITDNVEENALAIARARQTTKPNWKGNKFTDR